MHAAHWGCCQWGGLDVGASAVAKREGELEVEGSTVIAAGSGDVCLVEWGAGLVR